MKTKTKTLNLYREDFRNLQDFEDVLNALCISDSRLNDISKIDLRVDDFIVHP